MLRLLTALTLILLAPGAARALESAVVATPRTQASLITEADSFRPGATVRAALRLRIAPGWYTYWENPGDSGAAPELAFSLPEGVQAGPIAYPTPERKVTGPVVSYGFGGEVVLPVNINVPQGSAPESLPIRLAATWLVCEQICVPEEGEFAVTLRPGTAAPPAEAALFAAADARMPRPSPWPAQIAPDGTLAVTIGGFDPASLRTAWFAPRAAGVVDHGAAQALHADREGLRLGLRPGPEFRPQDGIEGVLVLEETGGRVSGLVLRAAAVAALPPPMGARLPLWQAVGFAVLGGLVLNLMPCVFPVLALKAMGMAHLAGHPRRAALGHAGAYAGGVLVTFLGLAGLLIAVRAAGEVAGWGFQFQSPAFVAAMAWLLFGVGLSMSGVCVIGGGRMEGVGEAMCRRSGLVGSFFTGLLAVLVATPCTAPFMGAAIAAALAGPPAAAVAVFLALGAGFALPFVALAALPGLARRLPRPGPWMGLLRQALAFPMYGAVLWLVWVLSQQAGPDGVLLAGAGMVLIGFALWAAGVAQARAGRARRIAGTAGLLAVAAALALLPVLRIAPAPVENPATQAGDGASEPFSAARLAALRAEGRPVFVNMTAAWCVTCLVNERVALDRQAVRAAFAAGGIVYLKGDWTRRDPEITDFLRAHGQDGVPLYVYYPAGGGPVLLPQILTEALVLARLGRTGA